jgi:hypothetical protein
MNYGQPSSQPTQLFVAPSIDFERVDREASQPSSTPSHTYLVPISSHFGTIQGTKPPPLIKLNDEASKENHLAMEGLELYAILAGIFLIFTGVFIWKKFVSSYVHGNR